MKKIFNIATSVIAIAALLLIIKVVVFQIIYGLHMEATESPEIVANAIIDIMFMIGWILFLITVLKTIEWAIKTEQEFDELKVVTHAQNHLIGSIAELILSGSTESKKPKSKKNDKETGDPIQEK